MAGWQGFSVGSVRYELTHLDPFEYVYLQAATAEKPQREYRVRIRFGHHCFTEGCKPGDDPAKLYPFPAKDLRTFNLTRWQLSQRLPDIIKGLMTRPVSHTGHQNFFTIDLTDLQGQPLEYEVYFEVSLDSSQQLQLVVTSAFPRDPSRLASRADRRPMRFALILNNTFQSKAIKPPPRAGRRH